MSIRILVDKLRNSERPTTIPRINAFRGANADDIEHTAFEIERMTTIYLANVRALLTNLNSNLSGSPVDAASRLSDIQDFMSDIVSDVRSKADIER